VDKSFVNNGFVGNMLSGKELADMEFVNEGFVGEMCDEVFVEVFMGKKFFHEGFVAMDYFNKEIGGDEFLDRRIKDDWMRVEQ
jgi:hypothetical protein